MKGWSNKRPEEEGYFWVVIKYSINGELQNTSEPDLWYIDPNGKYGCCAQLGTDDPQEIPNGEVLIDQVYAMRDSVYCWDSDVTATKKRNDKVMHRWEYWIKPIPEATFNENHPVDAYLETHQKGIISVEQDITWGSKYGDVGIQIASDGRIWLCYNGQALIRFKPSEHNPFENQPEKPYNTTPILELKRSYNPNYGDHRICICGHLYERHFDSYENMRAIGCKYCECYDFVEDQESNNCIKK